jgi:hypothetical protein
MLLVIGGSMQLMVFSYNLEVIEIGYQGSNTLVMLIRLMLDKN